MTSLPLVSCITPTANRREFILGLINNFLKQDYKNKELIIIDDGDEYINDLIPHNIEIKFIKVGFGSEMTIGRKRNIACGFAGGEYIVHFDNDDYYSNS